MLIDVDCPLHTLAFRSPVAKILATTGFCVVVVGGIVGIVGITELHVGWVLRSITLF